MRKKKIQNECIVQEPLSITDESVQAFFREEEKKLSEASMYHRRGYLNALLRILPEDKSVTKEFLTDWRHELEEKGYSYDTIANYVKTVNRYLRFCGRDDLCFTRGKAKDLTGQTFGFLTAVEPTDKKWRSYVVWRCKCRCGNEVEVASSRLLLHNVMSCGCLFKERMARANRYIDGTDLRQSLDETVFSKRAVSGYIGVTPSRHNPNKWDAYIHYKGKRYALGTYSKLDDAVKARARGKEMVIQDALDLEKLYEEIHKDDEKLPKREDILPTEKHEKFIIQKNQVPKVLRSNNTSGYRGVFWQDKRWNARITYQRITYRLGSFKEIEAAIAVRKEAEALLESDPQMFIEKYAATCSKYKNN